MRILEEMTDEELALAYVEGNNKAFDLLLSRNEVKLFSYIMFVVHDEQLANDIFQETFVKAIVKLQNRLYSTSGKFSSWLMRIAHNVIIDGYREQGHFRRNQVLDDVQKLMMYLPANQREVVYMRYYQQMSFKEIAETTNVSINTSLGRMRYALLNLRRMAKEHHICLQLD